MAREILVQLLCDPCLAVDERVEGRELPPLWLPELQGRRQRVITLCEVHEKELYTPLVELLEEHGQPVDEEGNPTGKGRTLTPPGKTPAHATPITCPECGHTSPNRSALGSHARTRHGKSLGQLLGLPTPYVCPECAYESSRPQGLAAHRRQVHGLDAAEQQRRDREAAEGDQLQLSTEDEPPKPPAKKAATKRAPAKRKAKG